jgi:hypothetical protein
LLRAVLAPDAFTLTPLEEADEDERARLDIPDEMLERTEAHDLRLADFVELVVDDARDGDLSRRYASEEEPVLACGVDPADSDCLTVDGLSVVGLGAKEAGWTSIGASGWSTDMRLPGASILSSAKE